MTEKTGTNGLPKCEGCDGCGFFISRAGVDDHRVKCSRCDGSGLGLPLAAGSHGPIRIPTPVDIVERLRGVARMQEEHPVSARLLTDAADELDRLRARIAELEAAFSSADADRIAGEREGSKLLGQVHALELDLGRVIASKDAWTAWASTMLPPNANVGSEGEAREAIAGRIEKLRGKVKDLTAELCEEQEHHRKTIDAARKAAEAAQVSIESARRAELQERARADTYRTLLGDQLLREADDDADEAANTVAVGGG